MVYKRRNVETWQIEERQQPSAPSKRRLNKRNDIRLAKPTADVVTNGGTLIIVPCNYFKHLIACSVPSFTKLQLGILCFHFYFTVTLCGYVCIFNE